MPSKSKAQQRFFGMVDAYKKGEMKNPSSKIKKAAKGMSMDDVKDFAETKHKGLPEKVEENIIRLTEQDLHQIVKESVNGVLNERLYNMPDNIDYKDIKTLNKMAETIKEIMGRTEYGNKQYLFDAYNSLKSFVIDVVGLNKR